MLKAKGKQVSLGVLLLTAVLFGVLGLRQASAVRATGTWTDLTEVTAADGLTETDYQITDAAGLQQLAQWVNAGTDFEGITLHIVGNLDLTGLAVSPIGTQTAGFAGTLTGLQADGTSAALTGLTQTGENYLGLFGLIAEGGRVENLILQNASVSGADTVALLAAQNNGSIENVVLSGGSLTGKAYVGGAVGINNGSVANLTAEGLTVTGNNSVGGLIGQNSGTLTGGATAGGSVTATSAAGGLVGINTGTLTDSENGAAVTGTAGTAVSMLGGVAGANNGVISGAVNTGTVTAGTGTLVGGIAGFNYNPDPEAAAVTAETAAAAPVRIDNVLNLGSVTADADYTAGLVGSNQKAALTDAYSVGEVTSTGETVFAGAYAESSALSVYTVLATLNGRMVYAEIGHGRSATYGLPAFEGLSAQTAALSDGNSYAAALELNGEDGSVFSVATPAGRTAAFDRVDAEKEDPVVFMVLDLGGGSVLRVKLFTIPTKDNEFTAEYTAAGYVLTGLNTNYVNYTGTVTAIPSVWTDHIHGEASVAGIAAGAFANDASAAQISVPATVTALGEGAFPYGTGEGQTQLLILSTKAQYDSLTPTMSETDLAFVTCRILVILAPGGGTMPAEVSYQRLYNRPLNFAQIDGVWQTDESFALPGASSVTRTGYTLAGWQTSGAPVSSDTLVLPEDEILTLTAAWALTAPVLAGITDVQAVYGQIPEITVSPTHALGVTYAYAWYRLDDNGEYTLLPETSDTLTLTDVADAGSYKIRVTATLGLDSASAEQTFTVTLERTELTVVFADFEGLIYDGTVKTITATFEGLMNGDDFVPVLTYDPETVIAVGTYTAAASLPEGAEANYFLTGTPTQEFTVNKASLTVVFADFEGLVYDGTVQTITATFAGLAEGDEFAPVLTYDREVKNAGTYTATASLPEGAGLNYELTGTLTREFTVAKAELTVVFADFEDLIYDGTVKTITASFTGLIEGEELTPVLTYAPETVIDAGDYTATASLPDNEVAANYVLTGPLTQEFTVVGAGLTVVFADFEDLIYDGTVKTITATFAGLGEGDEFVPVLTYDREVKNAGTYTATASLPAGADNYTLVDTVTCEFTVAKAELTVTFTDTTLPYNGNVQSLTAAFAGLAEGDVLTPVVSYGEDTPKNVGVYTATASLPEDELAQNYELTGPLTSTFEITRAQLTVHFNALDLTYNGQDRKGDISASFVGLQSEDVLPVAFTFPVEEVVNAGTYTVTASLPEDNELSRNYELTGTVVLEFEIKKAPLTVTFTNFEGLVYNAQEQQIAASFVGLLAGQSLAPVLTYDRTVINAGTYTATASLPDNEIAANYVLTGTLTQEFAVAKAQLTVTFTDTTLPYNGAVQSLTAAFEGLIGNDALTPAISYGEDTPKNVGTYTATVSLPEDELAQNYELTGTVTSEFIITGVELTVVFDAVDLTYNGQDRKGDISASFVGLQGEDVLSVAFTFSAEEVVNAGAYTVTASLPEDALSANYTLTGTLTLEFEIKKATLTVVFADFERLVYDGTVQTITAAFAGLAEGDEFVPVLTYDREVKNAGTYTATASLPEGAGLNYELTGTLTREFTVAKAELTVTFTDTALPYNGNVQSLTAAFVGLAEGDVLTPVISYGEDTPKNVGVYTATVSLPEDELAQNYELTGTLTSTFEITRAQLTVRFNTVDLTYNGHDRKGDISASFEGLQGGDVIAVVFTFSAEEVVNAGIYTVTASLPADNELAQSYELTGTLTLEFEVKKAPLTVTFTDFTSLVYNAQEQQIAASLVGLLAGQSLAPVLTYDRTVINAGTYTATASLPDNEIAANYVLTGTLTQEFAVARRDLTVGFDEMDLTYNGQDRRADINGAFLSGLQGSDTLTLNLAFLQNGQTAAEVKNAGTYALTVSLPDSEVAANYSLSGGTELSRDFEITRRVIGLEVTGAEGLVYDGTEKVLGITFTNIVAGETLEPVWSLGEGVVLKNAGTYTLTVTLPDNEVAANYTLSAEPYTVTIQKATLTVTFEGADDLVYDGTEKVITATADGFAEGESFELTLAGNVNVNAGTYTVTAALPEIDLAANYVLEGAEREYVIARRQITVTFVTTELTYSGADQTDSVEVAFDNAVEGEQVQYALTSDPAGFTDAGVYTLTLSLTEAAVNANYELTGTVTGTVEILRKGLTVRYEDLALTYNGQVQIPTASFEGLIEGQSLTPVLTCSAESKNVGNYTVTAALPETGLAANYVLEGELTAGFAIAPAELTVVFSGYEGLVYNGEVREIPASFEGLVNGESLTPALTYSAEVKNAGDYTVTAALPESELSANYVLTGSTELAFTVAKADPSYTLPSGLTATYGDSLSSVTLPAGWAWATPAYSVGNAGTNSFEATFTPDDTLNYNVVTENLTVTVRKAMASAQPLSGLTAYYRDQLSDIRLPQGWYWADPDAEVGEIGTTQHLAYYSAGNDNYSDAPVTLTVVVQARPFSCNGSVSGLSFILSALTLAGAALFLKKK